MRDQSCMPFAAGDTEAVIRAAEEITREAAAKARRKAVQEEKRRRREEERDRKAADQRERDREQQAERERLRAEADAARTVLLKRAATLRAACGGSIRDCLAAVADPRDPRGIRHSLPCVLTLVVQAVLHGKTKLNAVTAWIANAGQDMLALAGARYRGKDGLPAPPSPGTVTRLLGLAGAQALSDAVACYLAAGIETEPPAYPASGPVPQPQLACDGKEVRGALRPDGTRLFILSAASGGTVIADREIPAKTNEIPEIGPMLLELNEWFPLAGWILTADALHTQDDLAKLAVEELLAQFVLTVKKNRPGLHAALDTLCRAGARRHVTRDKGHGRAETRSHLVMDAPEEVKALFPHVSQIARVHRVRTVTSWKGDGKKWRRVTKTTRETVYVITSLSAREAGPEHIAAYIRSHWGIENDWSDCTYG